MNFPSSLLEEPGRVVAGARVRQGFRVEVDHAGEEGHHDLPERRVMHHSIGVRQHRAGRKGELRILARQLVHDAEAAPRGGGDQRARQAVAGGIGDHHAELARRLRRSPTSRRRTPRPTDSGCGSRCARCELGRGDEGLLHGRGDREHIFTCHVYHLHLPQLGTVSLNNRTKFREFSCALRGE